MKRISQIIIMMLAVLSTATFAFGETIVQKGKVLRYNGKKCENVFRRCVYKSADRR